jgi:predicted ArsR family transcriptional regulator
MDENVAEIRKLVRSDSQLTCKMIADELDMSKETVRKILVQDLVMRKLAACAAKLEGGRKGQASHFVHGLCRTPSGR